MIPNSILMFTDGASKGNPGPGGFGMVIVNGDSVFELGGREEHTTNNRMELTAAIEALRFLKEHNPVAKRCTLYADSSYLVTGITKWVHGWQKNGWRTVTKKDVENRDLWEKLAELTAGLSIKWKRVAGHADTPGNARADEIASAFGEGETPKLFSGPRSDYKINVSVIGTGTNSQKSAVRKHGSAYSYVSMVDRKILTHKTWKECEARVKGKRGARYKKSFSLDDERHIIEDFSK